MWAVRAVLMALLIIVVIAFAFNNLPLQQLVDVNLEPFFASRTDVPLLTVIFWAFASGVGISLVLFITTYVKLSVQLRTQRRQLKALEHEVTILRNRPIEESADMLKGLDAHTADDGGPSLQKVVEDV